MKKDGYTFPCILSFESDGISIEFPDLEGCYSCAHDIDEAVVNAKESMSLHLYGMEEDNEEIPTPTPIDKIKLEDNQKLLMVTAGMTLIRGSQDNISKKLELYYQ